MGYTHLARWALVPVLAANAILPASFEQGSVTDTDGGVIYSGIFDRRGRLVRARVKDDEVYREIERLDLDELGEHPIVERARVRTEDGNEVRTWTPIIPQIDLNAMYETALAEEGDGDDRGDLVNEQLKHLRDEGQASVLDVALEKGGPKTAARTVACVVRQDGIDYAAAEALAERVTIAACDKRSDEETLQAFERLATVTATAVRAAVASCEPDERRTVLRLWSGERPTDAELVDALHDPDTSTDVRRRLDPRLLGDRRVFVMALDVERATTPEIAKALERRTTGSPTPDESLASMRPSSADPLDPTIRGGTCWAGSPGATVHAVSLRPT